MTESVYAETKPRYQAGYVTCAGCYELARQQDAQRVKDAKAHKARTGNSPNPELLPREPTTHRHWVVQTRPDP